jgi:uncharacterized membrane protein
VTPLAGYVGRVRQDIARWVESGLIDAGTAEKLTSDIEANARRSLSFGSILAMLAAVLLAAAIMIFVAANWEAIPRIARVLSLFVVIAAGYVGGAWLKLRDHPAFAEAAWVVAAAAFGGSIALIGQMYHFSGDESGAILTWWAGTTLAAVALRSNPLTIMGVLISGGWVTMKLLGSFSIWRGFDFPHAYLVMLVVLFAVSYWTRSRPSRHLVLISLIGYAAFLTLDGDRAFMSAELAAVSAAVFGVAVFAAEPVDRIAQLGGRLPLHAFVGFLVGMFILQFQIEGSGGFAPVAAITLAGIAAAIVLAGRESRGLRWIAYVGFAFELIVIYVVMMETMLGTAGFFLAAAVILGILAFAIIRIEKRMKGPTGQGAVS